MATIYEVAELAGVSVATVSRVLNGNAKVSDRTKEKVITAVRTLGYVPNSIAQSLASNRTNRVGVMVSELHGPFFSSMLAVIEDELRQVNKHAVITTGHSDEAKEKDAIEFLRSCRCDVLILCVDAVSDEYLVELSQQNVPFVIINHDVSALSDRCFSIDNELGGYLATKAAIDHGHRNIAYVAGPDFKEDARLRLAGHRRALAENSIEWDPELLVMGDYHEESGRHAFFQLYKRNVTFSALVCANDDMAAGAMFAARDQGLELPEELSIIGFDDLLYSRYTYPQMTTVNNPIAEMGLMAARWVLKNIYDLSIKRSIQNRFQPQVIFRDSLARYQPCDASSNSRANAIKRVG